MLLLLQWSPNDATDEKCVHLMSHYDYHHRAFKMCQAKSKPFEFHMSLCLLSLGGFVRYQVYFQLCSILLYVYDL